MTTPTGTPVRCAQGYGTMTTQTYVKPLVSVTRGQQLATREVPALVVSVTEHLTKYLGVGKLGAMTVTETIRQALQATRQRTVESAMVHVRIPMLVTFQNGVKAKAACVHQ